VGWWGGGAHIGTAIDSSMQESRALYKARFSKLPWGGQSVSRDVGLCRNALQCVALCCTVLHCMRQWLTVCCSVLQCVAAWSVVQCIAVCL